jgi:hypothetical protein
MHRHTSNTAVLQGSQTTAASIPATLEHTPIMGKQLFLGSFDRNIVLF